MSNRLYRIQEVADILGVSTKTLRRWDQRGRFVPARTVGNQRCYTQAQINKFRRSLKSSPKIVASDRLYKIQEVAVILKVSTKTLRRWDQQGRFVPTRTVGNQRRYTEQQIAEFKASASAKATARQAKLKVKVAQADAFIKPEAPKELEAAQSLPSVLSKLPSDSILKHHFLLKSKEELAEFGEITGRPTGEPASFAKSDLAKLESSAEELPGDLRPPVKKIISARVWMMLTGLVLILSLTGVMVIRKFSFIANLSQEKEQFAKIIADLPKISINPRFRQGLDGQANGLGFMPQSGQAVLAAATGESDLILNVNVPSFFSQSIGIGTTEVEPSAILELASTEKGFLAPRMTTDQRDAIESPAAGLFLYNNDTNQYNMYDGTVWKVVGGLTAVGDVALGDAFTKTGTAGNSLWFHGTGGGVGELTAGAISGTQTYTLPNASGEISLLGQTISNSELVNSKVTVTAGTNMTGGGEVALGSSVTLTLKDSIDLAGTLDVSGATVLDGALTAAGATLLNGNVTLGDATTDTITFTGRVAADSDLIPIGTTGTNDLGSATLPWDNLYSNNVIAGGTSGIFGWLQRNNNALSPTNISDDILVGGTATASALIKLTGTTGNNSWINTGNVGIGNTAPSAMFTVGSSSQFQVSSAGVVTIPANGLTINTTNVTATGAQLNYLNAATGTTGTTSTNLVFSTSPTLVTPNIGAATATSIRVGDDTLDTNEWANLDEVNQTLATTSSPTFFNITDSSLTPERLVFAGIGGLLVGDSDLTFAADTLSATKLLSSNSVSTPSLISTGAIGITPNAGSNLNVSLSGTGDFAVNTSQLYVDTSAGSVGIGTTAPGAALEVNGQVKITGGSPGNNKVLISDDNGLATWGTLSGVGGIIGSGTQNYVPKFDATYSITNSSIFDNGNVGIGTTDPAAKLDVNGTTNLGGNVTTTGTITLPNSQTITGAASYTQHSGGISVGGGTTYGISSTGVVTANTTGSINSLNINAGSLSGVAGYTQATGNFAFSGAGNFSVDSAAFDVTAGGAVSGVTTLGMSGILTNSSTGNALTLSGAGANLAFTGAGLAQVTTAASQHLALMPGGNVGIGTTDPAYKLDVQGKIYALTQGTATGEVITAGRSIDSGNGLTGGGDLTADRTLAVGAGAGITVTADEVALTTPGTLTVSSTNSSNENHTHAITSSSNPGGAASLLSSAADGGLQLLRLGLGADPDTDNRLTIIDGGQIGQTAGLLMAFDDTNNYLEITGGNVGIGTTAPSQALDVNGTAKATGAIIGSLTGVLKGTSGTVGAMTSTSGYVTYWDSNNTISGEQYLATSRGGLGANVTAAGAGELLYSTGTTAYGHLASDTAGKVLISGGAGAPSWGTLGSAYGGTNWDSSAASGMVKVTSGTWSAVNGTTNYAAYWSDNNTIAAEQYLSVSRGGTGVGTFTQNGVLYGNTTSGILVTDQGGTNTILTANGGAPSFSASPSINTSVSSPIFQGISGAVTFGNASYGTTITGSGLTVSPTSWTAEPTISGLVTGTLGFSTPKTGNAVTLSGAGANIAFSGAGLAQITTAASQHLALMPGGNVGIGTTDPAAKLDVNGTTNLGGNVTTTGTITLPNSQTITGAASYTQHSGGISVGGGTTYGISSTGVVTANTTGSINSLNINAGSLSGVAGYTQATGNFAFSGAGNFSVDSAAFDVTAGGAVSGVTTLGMSGILTNSANGNAINLSGTNPAIYTSSTNRLDISANSATLTVGGTNGNIGIGTTAPEQLLDVQGAAQFGSGNVNLIDSTGKIAGLSTTYFNTDSSANLAGIITDETGSGKLTFATSPTFLTGITLGDSSAATFVLTSALSGATDPTLTFGNDLITTSGDLQVTGNDISDSGSATRITLGATTTLTNTTLTLSGTTTVTASSLATLTTAATLGMSSTTALNLGSNATINGGTAANDDLTLQGTSNATRDTSYVLLQPTAGNVGIGTTAPAYKLEVNGTLGTQSTIYAPNIGTGTDNSVVVLNTSGNLVTNEIDSKVWDDALTDYSGSSANYIAKFSDADTLTNSILYETNGNIGIGTTAPNSQLHLNATQTTGTVFDLSYGAVTNATGDLTGSKFNLDDGNLVGTDQNITGLEVKLPTVTNTITTGTKTLKGFFVNFGTGSGINQNGAGGTTTYNALDVDLPSLTQTAGTLNVNGLYVDTPSSITTGGTASGVYVNSAGVTAGSLYGVNITGITGGSGTERALNIGSGWDSVLTVNGTSVINGSGVAQIAGGGTNITSYATGDMLYASATNILSKLTIGSTEGYVLKVQGGVPVWGTIGGDACTNCLISNPSSTQTISPTGQASTGLSIRQTSTASPTNDIFNVTNSAGDTKYFYIDSTGTVHIPDVGAFSGDQLTIEPGTDKFALKLLGTNVTTQPLQIINPFNTSGTIFNMAYPNAATLAGDITGFNMDLSTNVTAANQGVTGEKITLPTFTNTNTTGTKSYIGLKVTPPDAGGINQNGAGGTTEYVLADLTMPALTQTAGTLNSYGLRITTPASITTGGTAYGINLVATGVGAGSVYGVNIGNITAGAGAERAVNIGTGWDYGIYSATAGNNYFAGNVGIGISAPATALHVRSAGETELRVDSSDSNSDAVLRLTDGTAPTAEGLKLWYDSSVGDVYFDSMYNDAAGDIHFRTKTAGTAVNALFIESAGNVGVGNTAPSQLFTVGSSSQFNVSSTGAIVGVGVDSGTGLIQGTGGITVTGTGNINAAGTSATNIGNSTGVLALASGGTSGWTNTAGNLTIQTATSGTMTVDSAGILNLGTTNSTATNIGKSGTTLTVNPTAWTAEPTISGTVTMTSGFDSNAASTVAGLTVDGDGNLTVSNGTLSVTAPTTTGNAGAITANSLTTGTGFNISSSSTAGGASGVSKLLNLSRSGANAQLAHTAYGIYSAVTNTNATSGTNIAGYFSASGATTANYGLIVENGNVGIGTTAPAYKLEVNGKIAATQGTATGEVITAGRTITSGNGLTGGGDLTADRTLAVGAGAGITVTADEVALTTPGTLTVSSTNSSNENHTHAITSSSNPGGAASLLSSAADGGLQLLRLGLGADPDTDNRLTIIDGGQIGQTAGLLMAFDDTNNYLEITGGNVGIGTTAPAYKLDVDGTSRISGQTGIGGAADSSAILGVTGSIRFSAGSITTNMANAGAIDYGNGGVNITSWGAASRGIFRINQYDQNGGLGLTPFYVDTSGNVGVGTTTPSQMFAVGSSSQFNVTSAGAVTAVGVDSGTGLIQGTGGITVTGTGNINAAGTSATNIGNSTGVLTLASGGTSSWTNTSGNLTIQTATSGTMTVDSAGILNLGTTNSTATNIGKAETTLTVYPTSWTATPTISGLVTGTSGFSTPQTGNAVTLSGAGANIAFSGAGLAQVTTAASQHLALMPGGNVGIGNTAPGAKFDVAGDIRLSAADAEIEFNSGGARLYASAGNSLAFHTGGGLGSATNEVMRMTTTGLGIGTTAPGYPLHIRNTANPQLYIDEGGTPYTYVSTDATESRIVSGSTASDSTFMTFYTASSGTEAEAMRIISSGNVGINNTAPTAKLMLGITTGQAAPGGPALRMVDATSPTYGWDLSLETNVTGNLTLQSLINGTLSPVVSFVRSNGNVGIGNTAPGTTLDVTGSLRNSGAVTFSTFTSNGGPLYTNGSGVVAQTTAGTSSQVLHGGTTPTFSAVSLTADVSGTLPIANGGTNATTIGSAGSVPYSTGTAYSFSGVGTTGQALISGGTGSPTWYAPTAGSILFAGASGILQQDNASLYFDDSNNRLGIGTTAPTSTLMVYGSSGTFFDVQDDGVSNFSVSDTAITNNLPTSFTAAGDVSMAYDLQFTNPTASYIKSYAPLYIQSGDSSSNVDLTLSAAGTGNVVVNDTFLAQNTSNSTTAYQFANAAGTAVLNIDTTNGYVGIGETSPASKLEVAGDIRTTEGSPELTFEDTTSGDDDWDIQTDGDNMSFLQLVGDSTWTTNITFKGGGNVGIGVTNPATKLVIDTASNSYGIRMLGLAETTEIADIRVGAGGNLTLSTADTGSTGGYIEVDAEDDEYGFIIRDSSTGSTVYSNLYMNDATVDYLNIVSGASNATTGLVVQTGGNVGVGTTAPIAKLQVSALGSGTSSQELLSLQSTYSAGNYQKALTWRDGTDITGQIDTRYDGARTNMVFGHLYNSGYQTSDLMTIMGNGNVGIGTTAPETKLDVVGGSILLDNNQFLYGENSVGDNSRLIGRDNSDNLLIGDSSYDNPLRIINGNSYITFETQSGTAEKVRITADGNVGIGTTNPTSKLYVLGDVTVETSKVGIYSSLDATAVLGVMVNSNRSYAQTASGNASHMVVQGNTMTLTDASQTFAQASAVRLDATAYAANNAITLSDASSLRIVGAPSAGTNVTITRPWSLYVDAGNSYFGGSIGIGTTSPTSKLSLYDGSSTGDGAMFDIYEPSLADGNRGSIIRIGKANSANNMAYMGYIPNGTSALNKLTFGHYGQDDLMVLQQNGNVGIGTTAPLAKLQVNGTMILENSADTNDLQFTDDGTTRGTIQYVPARGFEILGGTSVPLTFGAGQTASQMVLSTAGNVGIGTTAPAAGLAVTNGDVAIGDTQSYGYRLYMGDNDPTFYIDDTNNGGGTTLVMQSRTLAGGTKNANFYVDGDGNLSIRDTSNNSIMYLGQGGNVGIGTTNPLTLLELYKTSDATPLTLRSSQVQGAGKYTGLRFSVADNTVTTDNYHKSAIYYMDDNSGYGRGDLLFAMDNAADTGSVATTDTVMTILHEGNVGIGTTNPANAKLELRSDSNALAIGTVTGTSDPWKFVLDGAGDGDMTIKGAWDDFRINMDTDDSSAASSQFQIGWGSGNTLAHEFRGDGQAYHSGNVGIGPTAPGEKLDISGNIRLQGGAQRIKFNNGALEFTGMFPSDTTATPRLDLYDSKVVITNGGLVGIGITTPTAMLSVKGTGATSQEYFDAVDSAGVGQARIYSDSSGNAYMQLDDTSGNTDVQLSTGGDTYFNGGNVGVGTVTPDAILHTQKANAGGDSVGLMLENSGASGVTTSSIVFAGNGGAGAEKARIKSAVYGDGYMDFHTNDDTVKMRITAAGYVGIGTTAPAGKLEVSGYDTSSRAITVSDNSGYWLSNGSNWGFYYDTTDSGTFSNALQMRGNGTIMNRFSLDTGNVVLAENGGNVGIGTTAPSRPLTVYAGTNGDTAPANTVNAYIQRGVADTLSNSTVSMDLGFNWNGTNYPAARIVAQESGGSWGSALRFYTSANDGTSGGNLQERLRIANDGNVGIGTTAPTNKLAVNGKISFADTNNVSLHADNGDFDFLNYDSVGNVNLLAYSGRNVSIGNGTSTKLFVQSDGNVGIGTTAPAAKLNISGVGRFTRAGSDNYVEIGAEGGIADILAVNPGSATYNQLTITQANNSAEREIIRIDTAGNVGIGTTSPLAKLMVYGSSGTFFDVQDDGVSNFSVSDTQIAAGLPVQFTAAGDVSMAYDLQFTNPTASYIKSYAPLYIQSGDSSSNVDLTLSAAGTGNVVVNDTFLAQNTSNSTTAYQFANAAGTSIMNIDTSGGNVGIGTTAPKHRLQMVSDGSATALALFTSTYDAAQNWGTRMYKSDIGGGIPLIVETQNGSTWYESARFGDGQTVGTHPSFRTTSHTYLAASAGNVGIGTTAPNSKLEVAGDLSLQTNSLKFGTSGSEDTNLYRSAANTLKTDDNLIVGGGNIGETTQALNMNGWNSITGRTDAFGNVQIRGGSGTGSNGNTIDIDTNNGSGTHATRMTFAKGAAQGSAGITSYEPLYVTATANSYFTGNVGIGTTAPGQLLTLKAPASTASTLLLDMSTIDTTTSHFDIDFRSGNGTNLGKIRSDNNGGIADLEFWTYTASAGTYTEKMVIDTSGEVGIGTTAPGYPLHVSHAGTTAASFLKTNWSADSRVDVRIGEESGGVGTNQNMWLIVGTPTYSGVASWADRAVAVADNGLGGFTIAANPGDIRFETGAGWGASYERMRIDSAGNVGIGTTAPGFALDVPNMVRFGNSAYQTKIGVPGGTGVSNSALMSWYESAANWFGLIQDYTAPYQTAYVSRYSSGDPHIAFFTGQQSDGNTKVPERMRIDYLGNVGIGTTAPTGQLQISSTMNAAETTGSLVLTHPTNYQRSSIVFPSRANYTSDYGFIEYHDSSNDSSGEDARLYIGTSNDSDDDIVLDPSGRLQIAASNTTLDTSGNLYLSGSIGVGAALSQGKIWTTGDIWVNADNSRLAFTTDGSTDSTPNVQIKASGNDTIFQSWTGAADTEKMRILGASGNVGIGTTNPVATLNVNGTTRFENWASWGGQGTITWDGGKANTFNILGASGKGVSIGTNGTYDRLYMDTSGNVGIGTTAPGGLLVVGSGLSAPYSCGQHTDNGNGTCTMEVSVTASTDDVSVYNNGSGWSGFNLVDTADAAGYTNATGQKYGAGMRFQSIAIPQGSTINSATIDFVAGYSYSGTTVNSVLIGEDADDVATFSNLSDYQTRRGTIVGGASDSNITSASVNWNGIAAWTAGTTYTSPDVSTIVQEIINRAGWTSSNDMVIFWDDHAGNSTAVNGTVRPAASWDNVTYDPPKLTITYTPATVSTPSIFVNSSTGKVGIGDTTPDGLLDVEAGGAVTTASYGINLSNRTTNVTTDSINKYGMYITSTGGWTGSGGTATNNYGLYVDTVSGADNNYGAYFAGNVGIGMTAPSVILDVTGDIEYTGTITDVSDRRLKENILEISGEYALDVLSQLQAKSFTMIGNEKQRREYGFIAQEVETIFPDAVSITDPENGYMGVSYLSFMPLATEAIKELNIRLSDQGDLIATNSARLQSLEAIASGGQATLENQIASLSGQLATVSGQLSLTNATLASQGETLRSWEGAMSLSSGNVGIGTTMPAGKFHVVATDGEVAFLDNGTTNQNTTLRFLYDDVQKAAIYTDNVGESFRISSNTTGDLARFDLGTNGNISFLPDGSGNVGIGTTSPTAKLEINGTLKVDSLTTGGSTLYIDGGVLSSSDISLKTNVAEFGSVLDKINALKSVTFDWKKSGTSDEGFIAQDVQKIFPELVTEMGDGTLGVYYTKFAPYLVKAIQEQQGQIDMQGNQLVSQGEALQGLQTAQSQLASQDQVLQAQIDMVTAVATQSAQTNYVLASDPLFDSLNNKITGMQAKIDLLTLQMEQQASVSAFLAGITSQQVLGASTSAALDATLGDVELNNAVISDSLNVLGRATVSDLGVTGGINAGLLTINGLDGEIYTLAGDLKLQSQGLGGIDMLDGKVTIDTAGNMRIAGTITADAVESTVYTVVGDQSMGSASLPAGTLSIEISTSVASESSKIFLTPTSLTDRQLTVTKKSAGKFKVAIPTTATTPITFDWWIVGNK